MNGFDRIAGYEREKQELASIVEIFNNRERYEKKGARLPKGVILYGDAGTGKTLFAQVLASECKMDMIIIDHLKHASIAKQLKDAFAAASESNTPTLIFIDEMDKILPNSDEEYYTDESKRLLTILLTLIDGMASDGKIAMVATCNNYSSLPESVTRAGRFDKKIELGLPDLSSRAAIIKMYAERSSCRFALSAQSIARLCVGFSCAELSTLVNECVLASDGDNLISKELIHRKIKEIEDEDIYTEESERDALAFACRNLGMLIVSECYGKGEGLLSLDEDTTCNSFFNAILSEFDDEFDDSDESEGCDADGEASGACRHKYYSKSDLVAAITVLLGGYAAEQQILGEVYDNMVNMLHIIDCILFSMAENAMLGISLYYESWRNERLFSQKQLDKVNAAFDTLTSECYERAMAIIQENEGLIQRLIPILTEKKSIEPSELQGLIASFGGIKTGASLENRFGLLGSYRRTFTA